MLVIRGSGVFIPLEGVPLVGWAEADAVGLREVGKDAKIGTHVERLEHREHLFSAESSSTSAHLASPLVYGVGGGT
jgi:hypothetical protein